ncbi:hypothetical protein GCM10028801_46050 [Nocardioides maradonensis]
MVVLAALCVFGVVGVSGCRSRTPAGATLQPGDHRSYNLVFGLTSPAGSTDSLGALVVRYVDDSGHTGTWTSKIRSATV